MLEKLKLNYGTAVGPHDPIDDPFQVFLAVDNHVNQNSTKN